VSLRAPCSRRVLERTCHDAHAIAGPTETAVRMRSTRLCLPRATLGSADARADWAQVPCSRVSLGLACGVDLCSSGHRFPHIWQTTTRVSAWLARRVWRSDSPARDGSRSEAFGGTGRFEPVIQADCEASTPLGAMKTVGAGYWPERQWSQTSLDRAFSSAPLAVFSPIAPNSVCASRGRDCLYPGHEITYTLHAALRGVARYMALDQRPYGASRALQIDRVRRRLGAASASSGVRLLLSSAFRVEG